MCVNFHLPQSYSFIIIFRFNKVKNGLTMSFPSVTTSQFQQLVIITFFLYVVTKYLINSVIIWSGCLQVFTVVFNVYINVESLRTTRHVSTYFLFLACVAPDGSPRLTTFLLYICKLPVIIWVVSNNKTVEKSAESPLPDGSCDPVSPLSPKGPCYPLTPMSSLAPLRPCISFVTCGTLRSGISFLSLWSNISFVTFGTLMPSGTTTRWPLVHQYHPLGLVHQYLLCHPYLP